MPPQQCGECGPGVAHQPPQHVLQRTEFRAGELAGVAPQQRRAAPAESCTQQRRLAAAGLALEHHEPCHAAHGLCEYLPQRRQLAAPTDKGSIEDERGGAGHGLL
jgi:hypothetical protein